MPRQETNHALRRFLIALLCTFIVGTGIGVPAAILAPVPQARAEVAPDGEASTAAADPATPDFGSSGIGVVGMPGLLARSGSQSPRQIASITKVVTALVVLERRPLSPGDQGPTITFGQRDVGFLSDVIAANGSWQPVQAGWRMSERHAIETMLIPSANNYAESLAVWAYGSVPDFLAAARTFLKANDLDSTTLVDTNGLSSEDRSTPADLVALGRLLLKDPVLAAVVAERTADEPHVGEIENTNKLLGHHGVTGLKTGTYEDGANLLFSARRKVGTRTVTLVGVVLGAKTHGRRDAPVPALLTSVVEGLHEVTIADPGKACAVYRTRWGGTARAVPARSASMLVWGRAAVQRDADVHPITGGRAGERVGAVTYRVGDRTVTVPLVLDRDVLAAPVWWRLTHPLR